METEHNVELTSVDNSRKRSPHSCNSSQKFPISKSEKNPGFRVRQIRKILIHKKRILKKLKDPQKKKKKKDLFYFLVFPGSASSEEPTCQCRRHRRWGFNPREGKIPWRRAWQPTPVFSLGESHGQTSLTGYSSWGCKESDMTEVTWHAHTGNVIYRAR